jgi:hypothetical protein
MLPCMIFDNIDDGVKLICTHYQCGEIGHWSKCNFFLDFLLNEEVLNLHSMSEQESWR